MSGVHGLWVLVLVGCNGNKDDQVQGDDEIRDAAYVPGAVPGVGWVTFDTDLTGTAVVKFGLDGLTETTPSFDVADGKVLVLGLTVGETYELQLVVSSGGEEFVSAILEGDVPPPPGGTPAFTLDTWEPSLACDPGGYVLFSSLGDQKSGVGILNRDGRYVWSVANEIDGTLIARAHLGRDGASILYNDADEERIDDVATLVRVSIDGETRTVTQTVSGHHDFVELPDGTMAWLGYDFRNLDVPGLGVVDVSGDTIRMDAEGVTEPSTASTLYNNLDSYPDGVFYTGIDMDSGRFLPGYSEFGHANSLVHRGSDGAYFMMLRWLDALVKVNGTSGEIDWVMGGIQNQFVGVPEDLFVHAHLSDIWDGGMLVFDNHDPGPSRLVEYALDEANLTYEKVWEYPSDRLETLLGDVRRIPIEGCDNLLVSFSAQGRILELTRDGQIVWEVSTGIGNVTSRVHYLPSLYDFGAFAYPD